MDLVQLARKKFGKLTRAEIKLFKAVAEGETADFSAKNAKKNDPTTADTWPATRRVKADRIAWLCIDRRAKEFVTHQGIRIRSVLVVGELQLRHADVSFGISFEKSCVSGDIVLEGATIRELDLAGTRVNSINGLDVEISLGVWLCDGFRALGEVHLVGATIGKCLNCGGGSFINPKGVALSLDGAKISGAVFLREDFRSQGELRMVRTQITGELACDKAELQNEHGPALTGDGLEVGGSVILSPDFRADGGVRLASANIGGNLICRAGRFVNENGTALDAPGITVEGSIFLTKDFHAQGEVCLLGSSVGGYLDCEGGSFSNLRGKALAADEIIVRGRISLRFGFKAEGEVRLLGAKIGGGLECDRGEFSNPRGMCINADAVDVGGNVFLRDFLKAEGLVSLVGARVAKGLVWTSIATPNLCSLDLRYAKIQTIWDAKDSWPEEGKLRLHGLTYDTLDDEAPTGAKLRLDWLRRQPKTPFRPQPYEHLAGVLRKMGHGREATKILIAKEVDNKKWGDLTLWEKFCNSVYGLFVDYGHRPQKALSFVIIFVVIGALLFNWGYDAELFSPARVRPYVGTLVQQPADVQEEYPTFSPLLYSIDTFVPIIDLHMESYWLPDAQKGQHVRVLGFKRGTVLRWYLWFHIGLGWVLSSFVIAAIARVVRREPRNS